MHAIALDIGGTKISGILANDSYRIIEKKRIDSPVKEPRAKALAIISGFIESFIIEDKARLKTKILGIGISFPEMIYPDGTIGESAKVRGLRGFNLKRYLQKRFKCPVYIENDADCFALGEYAFGAGKGAENMLGVIFGTGVGAGIIVGGKLYKSSFGSAAEIGHSVIDPSGPKDGNGVKGSIEAFCCGPAIVKAYKKAGGKIRDAHPGMIFASKEKAARDVSKKTIEYIGMALGSMQNALCPDIIVLGGGVSNISFYKEINAATAKYTTPPFRRYIKIVRNRLGDDAGVYGAAALVFKG